MKTLKEFCNKHKDYAVLIKRVYKQLKPMSDKDFFEEMDNVSEGGASAGFTGFMYYGDCADFFKKNREDIIRLLYSDSEELGEGMTKMIKEFNSLKDDDYVTEVEIGKALFGKINREEYDGLYSTFAAYALEKVAWWYANDKYEEENKTK